MRPADRSGFFVAAVLLACAVAATPSGQAALPTGREIIARHVEAIGGEAAWQSLDSVVVRGRWEVPAQRIVGTLEVQSARPNKLLHRVTVAGIGRIENGYDGMVGWSLSPLTGPELLTGRQLEEMADEAWFDGALHLPRHVSDVTTLALDSFDGRPAYRVRVAFPSGQEQLEYLDAGSGLQIGTEAVRATPQGNVPTVSILRDYRPCGPVQQPGTIVQRALGLEQVVTVTACELDAVPADTFQRPPEIQALLEPDAPAAPVSEQP